LLEDLNCNLAYLIVTLSIFPYNILCISIVVA